MLIHNSTARKIERLFNALPQNIRNLTEQTKDTFNRHLDKWLRHIPDTAKIDGYGSSVAAESINIVHQARYSLNNQNLRQVGNVQTEYQNIW